jgi:uroporphyrinogen-III decarboxylase
MKLTNRERYKAIAKFQRPGDLYITEQLWPETLINWVKQGAPKQLLTDDPGHYGNELFRDYFKIDNKRVASEIKSGWGDRRYLKSTIPGEDVGFLAPAYDGSPLVPGYESEIIAEDEHTITYIDGGGQTLKNIKNKAIMPMFLDWPVKDRATWNEHKKRLDPNTPGRFPADWNAYVKELNSQDDPVVLNVGGFYGHLRDWIGSVNILYMFHDDPGLLEEMMDQMLYLETEVVKRTVKDIKVDEAYFYEDMAYKAGPFISPKLVTKYMVPRYKQMTELLRSHGVEVICVDCDGNIAQLIPLWLESGINYVWPLEQAAGNDLVAYRKKYGKDLILAGGIDKRALIKGKEAIREEVLSKVPFLLEQGGYFPTIDHGVPPEVTFENYRYYINTIREAAGLDKLF